MVSNTDPVALGKKGIKADFFMFVEKKCETFSSISLLSKPYSQMECSSRIVK